jgi:adenosylcobinamide-phosphate synthase
MPGAVLALALVMDRLLGEPPDRLHPIVYLGRGISALSERLPKRTSGGVLLTLVATLAFSGSGYLLLLATHGAVKLLLAAVLLKLSVGWRALGEYTLRIKNALERGEIASARELLPYVVSRNPEKLNEAEISSACVESIAENSVDAVAAPLLYFALFSHFSLELGVAAALAYRAVNTLDAMVGYPHFGAFGTPSARLDDLLNFPAVRVFAPFLLLATLLARGCVSCALAVLRRDRKKPASPNAGISMSLLAGALQLRLVKPGHYALGEGRAPKPEHISRALNIVDVALLLYSAALLALLGW